MNNFSNPLVPPDRRALLQALKSEIASEFNCHQIGTVLSFNAVLQTAVVKLVLQRAVYNNPPEGSMIQPQPTVVEYPTLVDVPVYSPSGGGTFIGMPVGVGDTCLVLFNDRDLDPWYSYGTAPGLPNSNRLHSLADGIALVGIRPATNPLVDFLTLGMTLSGNVNVSTGASDVFTSGDGATVTVVNGIITNIDRS